MRIVTVVGARPQFIKAASVTRILRQIPTVKEILVHTGQHYDEKMSEIFFDELSIAAPEYNLGVGSGTHGQQTGRMLESIEAVLLKEKPDLVLVYGDTNSTLAGALAAVKLHIPAAHIESGLRSFNRRMPEEINRILTDHSSDLLFAPTNRAVINLKNEGILESKIELVGDVMYDVALYFARKAQSTSTILSDLDLRSHEYILATVHRAENTNNLARLRTIFEGLVRLANDFPIVLPLHPRTKGSLESADLKNSLQFLKAINPVGYLDMVCLEKNAAIIVTDSGGIQKEAFFHRVPCVTLREETEWLELVELGWNKLVSPLSPETIIETVKSMIKSKGLNGEPYGDGHSAEKIVGIILNSF